VKLAPTRQALDHGERPDPSRGIFETIHVVDGRAPELGRHLERLASSARALYGVEPAPLPSAESTSLPAGEGRLRVSFVPSEPVRVEHGSRPADPVYIELAPFVLPGGLGPHKWLDRTLLNAITAAAGGGALPLILDEDGAVLEATWANVLVEEHGRLIAPVDDGRALPGIGRARLQYDEEPVDLDRLLAADAVVLTSALRVVRLALSG
jgi:para-aminobenzoate synthetase / 4-amino-4-deoxychorismate lyase